MLVLSLSKINILCSLFLLAGLIISNSAASDPSEYFGGVNNDAYLAWVKTKSSYNSAFFQSTTGDSPQGGAAVHWRIDTDNQKLFLAVAVQATGWVGVGMAEAGGMRGSDMVVFEASKPKQLTDMYVLEDLQPLLDDCQDWNFVESANDGGFLIFEGSRNLDTGDGQDHVIFDDSNDSIPAERVIVAWGDSETMSFHGNNRAKGSLRWFGKTDELENFRNKMAEYSDGSVELLARNYTVPGNVTTYVEFCFNWDDMVELGLPSTGVVSVVGVEALLDPVSGPLMHHATVVSSTKYFSSSSCAASTEYDIFLYTWAPGELPFALPQDVGYFIGPDDGGIQSFRLQVHYNNPDNLEGVVDNSGLRVYYTHTKRPIELGVMSMADSLNLYKGTPILDGVSRYEFECPQECSTIALDEPVTVLREYFHMHKSGMAGISEQIRDGKVIHTTRVNFWEFAQAGMFPPRQESFVVQPGDMFRTKCFYRTINNVSFGGASTDEMCHFAMVYYPAKRLLGGAAPWGCVKGVPIFPACNAAVTATNWPLEALEDDSDPLIYERNFGVSSTNGTCQGSTDMGKNDLNATGSSGSVRGVGFLAMIVVVATHWL